MGGLRHDEVAPDRSAPVAFVPPPRALPAFGQTRRKVRRVKRRLRKVAWTEGLPAFFLACPVAIAVGFLMVQMGG